MKRLFVRLFFRFSCEKTESGKYVVIFKPPFGEWTAIGGEIFLLKKRAMERAEEIRKDGDYLFTAIWNS